MLDKLENLVRQAKKAADVIKSYPEVRIISHYDSVTGDQQVLASINGKIKRINLSNLFEYCSTNFGIKKRLDGKFYSIPNNVKVFSINDNNKIVLSKVKAIIKHRTNKNIYKIRTKTGEVKVTQDHSLITLKNNKLYPEKPMDARFLASPRFYISGNNNTEINLLKHNEILPKRIKYDNDFIEITASRTKTKIPTKIKLDKNFMTFFGLWVADGCYAKEKGREGVHISCYDSKECRKIIDSVFQLFGTKKPVLTDNGITACIGSKTLYNLMKYLGFKGYSHLKQVPDWIFSLKKELIASFLSGYFSGDGTVSKGDINATSFSKKLVKDIQTLLLFLGIRSCIRKEKAGGGYKKNGMGGYKLSINANEMKKIFLNEVGFWQHDKNKKIIISESTNYADSIPIDNDLTKKILSSNLQLKHRKYLLGLIWDKRRQARPTRRKLIEIANNLGGEIKKTLLKVVDNDIFWEKRKSIELISKNKDIEVYDIATENGNFICENLVLKNTDGITSAAILTKTLVRENKDFHLSIVNQLSENLIKELAEEKRKLIVFLDLGSGQLDIIQKYLTDCEIVIADHHQQEGKIKTDKITHVNPLDFGIEADISAAGVVYLLARAFSSKNRDLAALAVIGAIGDSQIGSIGAEWGLLGLNKEILKDAIQTNKIKVSKGLRLFGRYTRPLHKALEYSIDPYIPGVSGSESTAVQFLQELDIKLKKENGNWRSLADLSIEEQRKLASGIIVERIKGNEKHAEWIFGDIYELLDKSKECKDANEFATILNATGKLNKAYLGIELCLNVPKAFLEVKWILEEYRKVLGQAVSWIYNQIESKQVKETDKAVYILAGDNISENVISNAISIIQKSLNIKKLIFGFANSEQGVKVSARANEDLVKSGVNLKVIVSDAAKEVDGYGGGHSAAAGATIPVGKEQEFINKVEKILGESNINVKSNLEEEVEENGKESDKGREASGEEKGEGRKETTNKKVEGKGLVQYFIS